MNLDETTACYEFSSAGAVSEQSFNKADNNNDGSVSFTELLKAILDNITHSKDKLF